MFTALLTILNVSIVSFVWPIGIQVEKKPLCITYAFYGNQTSTNMRLRGGGVEGNTLI